MDAVAYLLSEERAGKRVNVNHLDNKNQAPIVIAKRQGKQPIIQLLIKHGAKISEDLFVKKAYQVPKKRGESGSEGKD